MDLKTARNISTRLNVPVDEVLALPLGQFVVFRRGQRPTMVRRYPILEDPCTSSSCWNGMRRCFFRCAGRSL